MATATATATAAAAAGVFGAFTADEIFGSDLDLVAANGPVDYAHKCSLLIKRHITGSDQKKIPGVTPPVGVQDFTGSYRENTCP